MSKRSEDINRQKFHTLPNSTAVLPVSDAQIRNFFILFCFLHRKAKFH